MKNKKLKWITNKKFSQSYKMKKKKFRNFCNNKKYQSKTCYQKKTRFKRRSNKVKVIY